MASGPMAPTGARPSSGKAEPNAETMNSTAAKIIGRLRPNNSAAVGRAISAPMIVPTKRARTR